MWSTNRSKSDRDPSKRPPAALGTPLLLLLALLLLPACSGEAPAPGAPVEETAGSPEAAGTAAAPEAEGDRIEFLELAPQTTAVVRFTAAPAEAVERINRARSDVWKHCDAEGIEITGPPFNRISVQEGAFRVETGWPVAGPFEAEGEVEPGQLPGGPTAALRHHGSYDGIDGALKTLLAWVEESGMARRGEAWISFEKRFVHDPDPATWKTRILLPIQEPAS